MLAATALIALLSVASAASPYTPLRSYLLGYMSNATIAQYSYYNLTLGGSNYVVAPAANGTTYLVLSSQNNKYSLMTSAANITPIMKAYFAQYENLSEVSYLNKAMRNYQSSLNTTLGDCITETGINPPYTNNFQNAILGCNSVPNCNRALDSFGPASPLGFGIQNFSIDYQILNNSFISYFGLVTSINASNAGDKMSSLGSDISNITSVVGELQTNPLFPPPGNVNFGSCNAGLASQQPWYCVAVGYCGFITPNTTAIDTISSIQAQLAAIIPSTPEIGADASAAARSASYYIEQANLMANQATYSAFLNATYSKYNATVAAATLLLAKSQNTNLSNSLAGLKASFSAILANGINVSINNESGSFNSLLTSVISYYATANSIFASASSYSSNYTLAALAAELNYRNVPPKLADLAAQLQSLDIGIGAGLNTTAEAAALPQLQVIGLQVALYTPLTTMGSIVKSLDGWFINAMLEGSNALIPSKLASAPTYAALLSFLIGIIIMALIYLLTYRRFSKHHKLRQSRRASMAWKILFLAIFILVLIYTYVTYVYAQAANQFLPFAYFTSYLHASKVAYVVLNGSSAYTNTNITACAGAISSVLTSMNKTVKTIQATNYSCVAGGTVSPLGVSCIDSALGLGTPVIALSATGNGIVYKGLYGTMLFASGANATGSSCIVAQLLSRK